MRLSYGPGDTPTGRLRLLPLGLFVLLLLAPGLLQADPTGEILFESSSLRIYRFLDVDGVPKVVLTNLDDQGNRLTAEESEEPTRIPPRIPPRVDDREATEASDREEPVGAGEELTVEVRENGETREVEIEKDGTTIIININNPAPPPAPALAAAPYFTAPVYPVGGLVGSYRYPDQQPFLGYGAGIRSPSLFGGLALNAGNNFGLKTGASCKRGFDCMFPPSP